MTKSSRVYGLDDHQVGDVLRYADQMFKTRIEYITDRFGGNVRFGNDTVFDKFQSKTSYKFNSVNDLLFNHSTFYPAMDENYLTWLSKADDPITSTETGFANITYGQQLWQSQDLSYEVLKVMPHKPWDRSGWNLAVARHATGGGQTEGGTLPDTDYQTPEKYNNAPKEIVHTYEANLMAELLSRTGDDNIIPMDSQRPLVRSEHMRDMASYLTQDSDTLAGNNLESLDRLTATTAAQVTALSYDAGDENIFGIDKSASTDLDPYVDHNSGTDRDFSWDLVDQAIDATRPYTLGNMAGGQYVIITGENTFRRMSQELGTKQRFDAQNNKSRWSVGLNGITPAGDQAGGFTLASYRDKPIVVDYTVTADTIERIYGIYLSPTVGAHIKDLLPTTVFASNDYIDLDAFKNKEAILTMAELGDHNPRAHWQIRDLQ